MIKKSSGITLKISEIEDIVKVIKSIENREILLTGTTRKITSQEDKFIKFSLAIDNSCLPLIKNVRTLLFCYH